MPADEFALYGRRFRWWEEDAVRDSDTSSIPLLKMRHPLPADSVTWRDRPASGGRPWCGKSGTAFAYRFDEVADFLLPANGQFVQAFLHPDAAEWAVSFVVSRGVLPRVLHLRGTPCLHASAVVVRDRVVAFCGPTGSGKSTLAAALAQRGFPLVTDDVLPVFGDPILAGPGLPEARLHPPTAAVLGLDGPAAPPLPGQTKSVWRPDSIADRALPLAAVYLLEAGGAPASWDTLRFLLANSFWLDAGETAPLATDLVVFSRAVRSVPAARLSFDLNPAGFDRVARLISSER